MTAEQFIDAASKVGIPGALLCAFCFALWRVVKPLLVEVKDAIKAFLLALSESQERVESSQARIENEMKMGHQQIATKLEEIARELRDERRLGNVGSTREPR